MRNINEESVQDYLDKLLATYEHLVDRETRLEEAIAALPKDTLMYTVADALATQATLRGQVKQAQAELDYARDFFSEA